MANNVTGYQAALGLQRAITLDGLFPSHGDANGGTYETMGTIHTYAWGFSAAGVPANGQTLNIRQYSTLFGILGPVYGGDGVNTFALPNLAGRVSSGSAGGFWGVGIATGTTTHGLSQTDLTNIASGAFAFTAPSEPEMTTTFAINAIGTFPGRSPTYDTIGMITQFAGSYAPNDSIPCDGRLLPISQYSALFAVIGTTYGGDGNTTFAVPDLRGRTIVGTDSQHALGETFGSDSQTITAANLPTNMGGSGVAITNTPPSIALNYLISVDGYFPVRDTIGVTDEGVPQMGEVLIYAGQYLPDGFVRAAGQTLPISSNQALFSLIGPVYGGDGRQTFQLPDLSGRAVVGTGAAPGLSPVSLGQVFGQDSFTLSSADFGPLTLTGGNGADARYGGDANDVLSGLAGDDQLTGNGGDDLLIGGTGADVLRGGTGINTASYQNATSGVVASLANAAINTGEAQGDQYYDIQNLTGSIYGDQLTGNAANNRLDGGAGNDVLQGGAGADTLIGGSGLNYASYDGAATGVTVDLGTPAANTGDAFGDTFQNIAGIIGSHFNDTLRGDGNANVIADNGGSDQLFGLGGDDRFRVTGTPTTIDGGDGTDTLSIEGSGTYQPATGAIVSIERVIVSDDATVDFSNLSAPFEVLRSSSVAGHGVSITGTGGADAIVGGDGADHLYGGAGDDTITITNAAGTVDGGIGFDTLRIKLDPLADATFDSSNLALVQRVVVVSGHSVDFTGVANGMQIIASTGNAAVGITGTALADNIRGAGGADTLAGGAGDDTIAGGAGDDRITGGRGADTISGGAGHDTFAFDSLLDFTGNNRPDRITDFVSGEDRIDLSAIDADGDASNGVQHFTFIGTDAFHAGGSAFEVNVRAAANPGVFVVQFDTNHDGKADASFQVFADHAPIATDFIL